MHKRATSIPLPLLKNFIYTLKIKNDLNYLKANNTLTDSEIKSVMYLGTLAKKITIPTQDANLIKAITNFYIHKTRTAVIGHSHDKYITFFNFNLPSSSNPCCFTN